ncbi:MAG: glycosyltransferase [Chloroflexota bacterium]|nr:glycosyltransferase [Chloroflexota bacterium]
MQRQSEESPSLSIVLVTANRFASLRRTVRHLRAQSIREQLELVIVAPSEAAVADLAAEEVAGFYDVRTVFVGPIDNVDRAGALGIQRASAPLVALVEDHTYPEPTWAEAVVAAQRGPWAVVGSAMVNANPRSLLSWSNLLIAYGRWSAPAEGGEVSSLPGHNVVYKREWLAGYGERLVEKVGREGGLLQEIKAKGGQFYLEPEARLHHTNPSTLRSTVALRFNAGRLYGGMRAEQGAWSFGRRLLYIVGGVLIPLVRFVRVRRELFGSGQRRELVPRVYLALLFCLMLDGLGQVVGYAFGAGSSRETLATFEMDRMRHVCPQERRAMLE